MMRTVQRPKMKRIAYKNIQMSVGNGGKGKVRGRGKIAIFRLDRESGRESRND